MAEKDDLRFIVGSGNQSAICGGVKPAAVAGKDVAPAETAKPVPAAPKKA